ncbi:MAG: hypothetical protein IRZ02_07160 [Acidothermus sp.]|nr:hypothetical protein [Acidothermus sp.]MCL6537173.1 hypothetical protein [Acidothermus sp.]
MDALDDLADELVRRARHIELLGDRLLTAAADALWTSVAADAFRDQVYRRRREFDSAAHEVRAAAAVVRHFAADVRSRKRVLASIEEWVGRLL